MSVLERDPEATAATLARWLREVAGVDSPTVTDVAIPTSTGWSNETVLFDATWGGERRSLVARIAPSGHQVFPDETFLRQHAVMCALGERTEVPMARVHWLETDPSWFGQPFWIMDRVDGDIPAEGTCLMWGDARLSNLIYRDFAVAAVLDWEMAAIGDPLADLGWWLFADDALTQGHGGTRLPGFPSAEETARRWSAATARSADALGYYEMFAGLRFTVTMLRMGTLLVDMGFVPPEFPHDNMISQALAERNL